MNLDICCHRIYSGNNSVNTRREGHKCYKAVFTLFFKHASDKKSDLYFIKLI